MITTLYGTSFIGDSRSISTEPCGQAVQPGTGAMLDPTYLRATPDEIERAMALAAAAFPVYSTLPGKTRAEFLGAIAKEIEAVVEDIVVRGELETALTEARLRSEVMRTVSHLRMFASLLDDGSWVGARIDRADPERQPLPKVDLRSMLRPLGPVAIFCAANFPLAYSVAGGDTASALAAGCPVIVIAHDSHPGVAEIVATAVNRAARLTDMPEGVFSMLYGGGCTIGQAVVRHAVTQAVGFTGSRAGGTALMALAAARRQPIPVYAEMSSVNPVIILPGALDRGEEALAVGLYGSLTLGGGQFCTNPGLIFLPSGKGESFLATLKSLADTGSPSTMLNAAICQSYADSTAAVAATAGVETLARAEAGPGQGAPAIFTVSIADFLSSPKLQHEMFGPATLIIRGTVQKIEAAIPKLEGQLTASLHATDEELADNSTLVHALQQRAGRLIFNGFPTSLEVCHSIVHGGPFPATSDGRSSSVGTLAIFRFCRPVAWQNCPDAALPPELQDANPLGIRRME